MPGHYWQLQLSARLEGPPVTSRLHGFASWGAGLMHYEGFTSDATAAMLSFGIGAYYRLTTQLFLRGDLRAMAASNVYGQGTNASGQALLGLSFRY